ATFFAGVVILTMFAAMSFDPRLIWDHSQPDDEPEPGRTDGVHA
ncbi:MAG: paraquat-inducible protein A, partial [Gammaproteobacteria bacterium]|nr:paraquat-inducible protein A [Gammaproteobacteria bacterium]